MPELPEVETVRRALAPWLTGRRILRARRADAPPGPKYLHLETADGQRIEAVNRRGKFLVLPLSGGDELIIHLGMTGQLGPVRPPDHVRVVVDLDDGPDPTLYFRDARRFGRFLVARGGDRSGLPSLQQAGIEPLSPEFTAAALRELLASSRGSIKTRLMSQRAVAGLGNIYVDEALWRARINPRKPSCEVSAIKVRRLRDAIVDLLEASIRAQGTTFRDFRTVGGQPGGFEIQLRAYGRTGQPCPRCANPIRRVVVAQRGTHFCPRCQRR